ncbi:MAG: M81 family metallopeptidase [Clostridia bacterium]|nr:M81 family metallopeptidase [Clostridia bacterium]
MKKLIVCGFHQESNTFNPKLAEFDCFDVFEAQDVNGKNEKLPLIFKGIFEAIADFKEELSDSGDSVRVVGGPVFYASSGGPVNHCVVDDFIVRAKRALKNAGNPDGVIVALHGATTSDTSEDVCGDIIEALRDMVGEQVPISSAFDLHANITSKIIKNTDYISGYQTYPHLDMRETGYRAAECLIKGIRGLNTETVCISIPQMAPAHAYTTGTKRLAKLMQKAQNDKQKGIIEDYSIFQVQPWLDVKEIASTVTVRAKTRETAERIAARLAEDEYNLRQDLLGDELLSVDEVIKEAINNKTGKPVVLADAADSPNAGACGDSAYILEKLLPYKDKISVAIGLIDVPAVEKAYKIGVGKTAEFALGATVAPKLSNPLRVKATVIGLYDGRFKYSGPQEHGKEFFLGKTAVLRVGKILMHGIERGRMGDPAFYGAFGIEPEKCDLVCVKACTSFRAAYKDIASKIYNANTPGAAGCVLTDMRYKNIPRPFYPFDEITRDMISNAKRCRKQ